MKKAIITASATLALVIALSVTCGASRNGGYYAGTMQAVKITRSTVYLQDGDGEVWSFRGSGWSVGDYASVLMHDNGTVTIYDDKICDVRHCSLGR